MSIVLGVSAADARAADALLFRIFLRDGSTLVSYGDFTRVADRVVFSIPIGSLDTASPALHLVSLAESTVDWEKTDRYAEAARARHYAATRGEADFEALSRRVARALNEVARVDDAERRLVVANDVRKILASWPASHHGYRAADVAQLSALMDEAVAELRVAAGQSRYDLSLVATTMNVPPDVPEMPPPTLRESIELAFSAARATPELTERVALLQAIISSVEQAGPEAAWAKTLGARASAELAAEIATDKKYREMTTDVVSKADARAKRADVNGIETLIRTVLKADDRLGRRRPEMTAALLATLDGRLDSARRLRLARDAWTLRRETLNAYQRKIRSAVDRFRRSIADLEKIRQLAGPAPAALPSLADRVSAAWRELRNVRPPAEGVAIHGMLVNAVHMAGRAAESRRLAIGATDMTTAWEASSAAAGALLLFERAQEELRKLTAPPEL